MKHFRKCSFPVPNLFGHIQKNEQWGNILCLIVSTTEQLDNSACKYGQNHNSDFRIHRVQKRL